LQSQTAITEKLFKTLSISYEKAANKILVKLTPDYFAFYYYNYFDFLAKNEDQLFCDN